MSPSVEFISFAQKVAIDFCQLFHSYWGYCSKYRSPCSFKRKRAFTSLSSLAWGKSLAFCMRTGSFARFNDVKIVHSRDAQGFARQSCCMAGTIDSFSFGKKCSFYCKIFSLFLPCNMAAVQNLCQDSPFPFNLFEGTLGQVTKLRYELLQFSHVSVWSFHWSEVFIFVIFSKWLT